MKTRTVEALSRLGVYISFIICVIGILSDVGACFIVAAILLFVSMLASLLSDA